MSLTCLVLNDGSVLSLTRLERGADGALELQLADGAERELALEQIDLEATLLANAPEPPQTRHAGDVLELKGLGHDVSGDYLSVEGMVANVSSEELRDLAVKILGYDAEGEFVTSGEALVDFNPLKPEAESPFKAILKSGGRVASLRAQFYLLSGETLEHRGHEGRLEIGD